VPKKSEIEKEGKAREEIRAKISPPLDPVVVSELVVWVLWWWTCTARGWPPLLLYPLGTCLIASRNSEIQRVSGRGWRCLGGLTVPP